MREVNLKKLLLALLIPGMVLAKEPAHAPVKPPEKKPTWAQIWKTRMNSCTNPKEKEYLARYKSVPIEYMLDPAKEHLAAAIYEEHRKIYLRIKPCLDKYEK